MDLHTASHSQCILLHILSEHVKKPIKKPKYHQYNTKGIPEVRTYFDTLKGKNSFKALLWSFK